MNNNNTYFELISNEQILVKATIGSQIDIFSSIDYHFITSLITKYDFGGKRIAISHDSKMLFCCGYYYGIQAINIQSKEVIWKILKIKSIQKIEVSNDGAYLYVLTETEKLYTIESSSGLIMKKEKGIRDFYKTNLSGLIITRKNDLYFKLEESMNRIASLENLLLSACSFQNDIVLSEMYKSLKRINIITGEIIWISELKPGFRVNHMANLIDNTIVILANYMTPSIDENHLIVLNFETGKVLKKTQIDSKYHGFCFSHNGVRLFCSNGDVFDSITHEKIF
jgi:hypothetical protein